LPVYAIDVVVRGMSPTVVARSELDLEAAPELRECLHRLDGRDVTVALQDVSFLDSTIASVLLIAHKRHTGTLRISNPSPSVLRILEVGCVLDVFDIEPKPQRSPHDRSAA
jgi:anti-anti-sigma factor